MIRSGARFRSDMKKVTEENVIKTETHQGKDNFLLILVIKMKLMTKFDRLITIYSFMLYEKVDYV